MKNRLAEAIDALRSRDTGDYRPRELDASRNVRRIGGSLACAMSSNPLIQRLAGQPEEVVSYVENKWALFERIRRIYA